MSDASRYFWERALVFMAAIHHKRVVFLCLGTASAANVMHFIALDLQVAIKSGAVGVYI